MELDSVAKVKAMWYRMVGATSSDPALTLNGESADDVAYQYLTRGCRVAQRWMIKCGYQGWRKRSSALTFSGTDAADGGRYVALPSDFLRGYGDQRKSSLTDAGGTRWGTEITTDDEVAQGDFFYYRGDKLWLTRGAQPPTTVYLDYHYTHPVWTVNTTIDFPLEARALIPAEAAELASGEDFWPGDQESIGRIERALGRAREEARDISRQSKQPRAMRKPYRLGNRYSLLPFVPLLAIHLAPAGQALPPAPPRAAVANVVAIQQVPTIAVSFASVHCCEADASQNVLASRHWLEVVGVDAIPNAAQVVQVHPFWHRADALLVQDTMRLCRSLLGLFFGRRELQDSVPVAVGSTDPFPAPSVSVDGDLGPEPPRQVVGIHSDLFPLSEQSHGQLDHGGLRNAETLGEIINEGPALIGEANTGRMFHTLIIPRRAVRR